MNLRRTHAKLKTGQIKPNAQVLPIISTQQILPLKWGKFKEIDFFTGLHEKRPLGCDLIT